MTNRSVPSSRRSVQLETRHGDTKENQSLRNEKGEHTNMEGGKGEGEGEGEGEGVGEVEGEATEEEVNVSLMGLPTREPECALLILLFFPAKITVNFDLATANYRV